MNLVQQVLYSLPATPHELAADLLDIPFKTAVHRTHGRLWSLKKMGLVRKTDKWLPVEGGNCKTFIWERT